MTNENDCDLSPTPFLPFLEGDLNFRSLAFQTPAADDIELDWHNPQVLKAGLRYEWAPGKRLLFSADSEDCSAFSENQLAITGGTVNPTGVLERNFMGTWSASVAFVDMSNKARGYSVGFSLRQFTSE